MILAVHLLFLQKKGLTIIPHYKFSANYTHIFPSLHFLSLLFLSTKIKEALIIPGTVQSTSQIPSKIHKVE